MPDLVSDVVAIDNCPIHLPLLDDFPRYLKGMAKVDDAKVKTHHEAEMILREYEDVHAAILFPPLVRWMLTLIEPVFNHTVIFAEQFCQR